MSNLYDGETASLKVRPVPALAGVAGSDIFEELGVLKPGFFEELGVAKPDFLKGLGVVSVAFCGVVGGVAIGAPRKAKVDAPGRGATSEPLSSSEDEAC